MLVLKDLDNLAARLHGRRSRLADGPRLAALCALGTPATLAAAVLPAPAAQGDLQGALIRGFIAETRQIAACLGGAWGEFARWQAARFQLENLKTALRGLRSGAARELVASALLRLPPGEACGPGLAGAATMEALQDLLPAGFFRDSLAAALARWGDRPPFFCEAALDRDYLAALSERSSALGGEGGELAAGLAGQEAAAFNLQLAARGRFFHNFEKKDLLPLFAPGPSMNLKTYSKLLSAGSAGELRALAAGAALDPGPPETNLSVLEALCWRRYARLAGRALRRGHMDTGAVAAYISLRRIETANLISVSEGLRLGARAGELARRLIPRAEGADA